LLVIIPILHEVAENKDSVYKLLVMARQLILAIAESAQSLEQQLKTSRTANQKERRKMLWGLRNRTNHSASNQRN